MLQVLHHNPHLNCFFFIYLVRYNLFFKSVEGWHKKEISE